MPNGWLNPAKYEHIAITGATGPGTMREGYAWRFVCHSTEGPPGSIDGTVSLFRAKPGYCPHFTIDPMGTQRRIQHIPWVWSSCALKGGAAGYETNRGRSVQMEICGYAKDSQNWPDDALWIIADVIADVITDGCPINPTNATDDRNLTGTLATSTAPQRMSWENWRLFDGICAHVRVPNNDHWDCGRLNLPRISQLVQAILAGQGRTVVPGPPPSPYPPAPNAPQTGFISKGMTGGAVKFIQDLLRGLGYDPGPSDGVFGFQTERAVMAFQKDHGCTPDGVVGPETNAAISAAYAPIGGNTPLPKPPDPAQGFPAWPGRVLRLTNPMMNGGDVNTWQAQMHHRGWNLGVDGWYGEQSRNVCLQFQREKGLTADGDVGPQTWNATWTTAIT